MHLKNLLTVILFFLASQVVFSQTTNSADSIPLIEYSSSAPIYEIAAITVTGAANYEDFVLIGFSGLTVGEKIKVPGDAITSAVKRFMKQGLFSM